MAFDIHQKIVNRYGELDEKKAMQYRDQLSWLLLLHR